MPTPQYAPGILQVERRFLSDGQKEYNVYHVDKGFGAAWTDTEIDAIAALFLENWEVHSKASVCANVALTEILCVDLTNETSWRRSYPVTPVSPGTNSGDPLPNSATLAVKFAVGTRGRGRNGRIFWPGIPGNQVTVDLVDSDYIDDVVNSQKAIITDLAALPGSPTLVVLSRYLNGAKRSAGVGLPVIDIGVSDPYIDSQRNRLPNHKRTKRNGT